MQSTLQLGCGKNDSTATSIVIVCKMRSLDTGTLSLTDGLPDETTNYIAVRRQTRDILSVCCLTRSCGATDQGQYVISKAFNDASCAQPISRQALH